MLNIPLFLKTVGVTGSQGIGIITSPELNEAKNTDGVRPTDTTITRKTQ